MSNPEGRPPSIRNRILSLLYTWKEGLQTETLRERFPYAGQNLNHYRKKGFVEKNGPLWRITALGREEVEKTRRVKRSDIS